MNHKQISPALLTSIFLVLLGVHGALLLGSREQRWLSIRPRWPLLIKSINCSCCSTDCACWPRIVQQGSNSSTKLGLKTRHVACVRYLYGAWMMLQMIGWDREEPPVPLGGALSHRDVRRRTVMAVNPKFLTHSGSSGQISLINSSQRMAGCHWTSITW